MRCLQAKPYKYTCYSCQAAVTCVLANRLLHVLGKDYFMLHKILCGFITAHSPFNDFSTNVHFSSNIVVTCLLNQAVWPQAGAHLIS